MSACPGSTLHLEFLLAAWEEDPLDGDLAASLLQLEGRRPCFDLELKQILTLVSRHWAKPETIANYQAYIAAKQFEQGLVLVRQALREAPDNLFWRQQAITLCEMLGHAQLAQVFLKSGPTGLAPLFAFLRGNMHFQLGNWEQAEKEYSSAPENMLLPYERRAEALERLGKIEKASGLRSLVLRQKPWHTTLALRTYETFRKQPLLSTLPKASTAVLTYSFNKAGNLDGCLESLAASSGWDKIFALNNGSTDQTAVVLQAWENKIGKDRFQIIPLPVNVGAAAARNWLITEASRYSFDFAAFLDDDVLLPPDWLDCFATARSLFPGAGVWGCRVVDSAAPYLAQSADMHILPGEQTAPPEGASRPDDTSMACYEPFTVSDLHNQVADFGQFNYIRPCDSVTGCCHVFPLQKLVECGLFDLQLSPSQYDDLAHDIRLLSQGGHACYQGSLAIRHAKRSGRIVRMDRTAYGNWFGNKFKMLRMFDLEDIEAVRNAGDLRLENDLTEKMRLLDTALEFSSRA